jgi:hypothetical protein
MTDRIDGSLVPDDHRDIEHAQSLLGLDARPTGRLRMLRSDILPTRMYRS